MKGRGAQRDSASNIITPAGCAEEVQPDYSRNVDENYIDHFKEGGR